MLRMGASGLAVLAASHGAVLAQAVEEDEAAVLRGEIELLQRTLLEAEAENDREVAALRARTEAQAALIADLAARVDALSAASGAPASQASQAPQVAQTSPAPTEDPDAPEAVGEAPPEETTQPRIQLFSDVGGILTPRGQFVIEPSLTYTTTSDNRFFFSGAEIVDALLIGLIEARDTQRTAVSFVPQLRYGLSSRFEVDVSAPFLYRTDQRRGDDISLGDGSDEPSFVRDLSASGLGDVSAGLHYQLNQGRRWPYVIANLRAKAPTGEGPLEVDFDEDGNPREAATGSGYWSIEPSLSFVKRVDPVALFANLGYQFNLEDEIDQTVRGDFYDSVDPGDSVRTSMGLGIALNERVNVSFGYDQSYVFASEARVLDNEGTLRAIRGQETTIGSFLFGVNTRVSPKLNLGFNASIGATDEAPDVNLRLRARYAY